MRCGKIRDLLSEYIDGRLSPKVRAEIDKHLAVCADCAAELEFLKNTVQMVRELPEAEPPEDFHGQLHMRLAKAEAERRSAPADTRTGFGAWMRGLLRRPALRGALAGVMVLVLVFSVAKYALPGWDGNVWTLLRGGPALVTGFKEPVDDPGSSRGTGELTTSGGEGTAPQPGSGKAGQDLAAAPQVPGATGNLGALGGDQIIYSATLTIEVEEFEPAGRQLEAIVTDAGGYVEQSSVSLDGTTKSGYYRVRVPQAAYAATIGKLEELGRVLRREQATEDVTGTVIDLEARISNLRRQELRLGELLSQAKTLDEILRVENELNRIRYQIEANEGQLKYLRDRVAMSSITVNLSEPKEPGPTPVPGADLWRRIWRAFVETWRGIGGFLEELVVFVASVVPVVLLLAALWLGYRRWRSSRGARGAGL